ncbi:MAG: glycosyltransferase family 2 protein, partial [Planctomycetota bacterium]
MVLAILSALALTGISIFQLVYVYIFVRSVKRKPKSQLLSDKDCRPAAVIVCVRGIDPSLRHCIDALSQQDYPDYVVHIVVDHVNDPSHKILNELAKKSSQFQIHILEDQFETCSLKCSSLIHAYSKLSSDTEIIAHLDTDTVPNTHWLRLLATELNDSEVGAVCGVRWYRPQKSNPGSLVRQIWNAAAVVQMFWYDIAWGGSMALKREVVVQTDLLERWKHALCEDTMLSQVLSGTPFQFRYVLHQIIENDETTTVSTLVSWITRQLITARLYHPQWHLVAAHGLITSLTSTAALILLVVNVIQGTYAGILIGLAIFTHQLLNWICIVWLESSINRIHNFKNPFNPLQPS